MLLWTVSHTHTQTAYKSPYNVFPSVGECARAILNTHASHTHLKTMWFQRPSTTNTTKALIQTGKLLNMRSKVETHRLYKGGHTSPGEYFEAKNQRFVVLVSCMYFERWPKKNLNPSSREHWANEWEQRWRMAAMDEMSNWRFEWRLGWGRSWRDWTAKITDDEWL